MNFLLISSLKSKVNSKIKGEAWKQFTVASVTSFNSSQYFIKTRNSLVNSIYSAHEKNIKISDVQLIKKYLNYEYYCGIRYQNK